MTGPIFAILGALAFAFSNTVTRRAVINSDVMTGVLISIAMTLPFFLVVLFVLDQMGSILNFTLDAYIWLAVAGILHYVVGRALFFKSVQLIGVNVTEILRRIDSLVALILGTALLGEPFSFQIVVGVLLIVFGVTITGLNPQIFRDSQSMLLTMPYKGLFFGCATGVLWGITPVLMRLALKGPAGSPVAGAFISFLAATIVLSISMISPSRRVTFAGTTGKAVFQFCMVGVIAGTANLMRFLALNLSPASVVTPLFSTSPLFMLILSYIFNRKLEIFNIQVVIGAVAVVIGSILIV